MELTPELLVEMKRLAGNSGGMGFMHKGHEVKVTTKDLINEIERLKAELETIRQIINNSKPPAADSYKLYEICRVLGGYSVESQQQPEPPQESLTPAELGEMAGRKVRVLRYMEEQTLVRPSIYALQRLFGNDVKETMIELRNDGLVWEYPSKNNTYREYVLTPQGMDYLATLDKPLTVDEPKSIRLQILEALPKPKEKGISYPYIADKTGLERREIKSELDNLLIDSLVTINNWGGWKLTVKGRDYLKSLEVATAE